MSYMIEDMAHMTSSLVKISDGKYLDIVVGKYVTTKDLTMKIDNFLTVIYSQVISTMRQATSTLATNLQVEALQSDAIGIPFASYNSIHESAETVLKSFHERFWCVFSFFLTQFSVYLLIGKSRPQNKNSTYSFLEKNFV